MTENRDRRVAAIDLGTNTTLMLVAARGTGGALEVIEDHCWTTRLGEGLATTGGLQPVAIERTLDRLESCARRIAELDLAASDVRCVSTAVLRRAADAGDFVRAARERSGLAIEIIPEAEEAHLGHAAVCAGGGSAMTWIVDVGGGSTEVVGESGSLRLSCPVGAVVLTEGFLRPADAAAWGRMKAHVLALMEAFPAGLAGAEADVVALGGSASNLACLDAGGARFAPEVAEGHSFETEAAFEQAERLFELDLEARRRLPIEADRAEILPAGLFCIAAALKRIGARGARVSGRGLRYGVAAELLAKLASS